MNMSFKEWQECKDEKLELGQKIAFNSRRDLEAKALLLSANGYGVALIGYSDIAASILTITAVPGGGEGWNAVDVICPYFKRFKGNAIECESLVKGFDAIKKMQKPNYIKKYACKYCNTFEYYKCPHAAFMEREENIDDKRNSISDPS